MKSPKSVGKCTYCQQMLDKRGIARHLDKHLKDLPADGKLSYHIRVEAGPYFLQLLIDGGTTLKKLDTFLRRIWLECCGHMSAFSINRRELGMTKKVSQFFEPGYQLDYEYDFGSTTGLTIKVLAKYPFSPKKGIELLSRNESLEIMCDKCQKQPAVQFCTAHWDEEEAFFCENCSEIHEKECEEAEYAMMPVVNSPRMGVCGYEGGSIDLERDKPFSIQA